MNSPRDSEPALALPAPNAFGIRSPEPAGTADVGLADCEARRQQPVEDVFSAPAQIRHAPLGKPGRKGLRTCSDKNEEFAGVDAKQSCEVDDVQDAWNLHG